MPQDVMTWPEDRRAVDQLGVDAREVMAFRRLTSEDASDQSLERLVLDAAALRLRLRKAIDQVSTSPGDAGDASALCQQGDIVSRRLEHQIHSAVSAGDLEEARSMQNLRMRLLRELAELWILLA